MVAADRNLLPAVISESLAHITLIFHFVKDTVRANMIFLLSSQADYSSSPRSCQSHGEPLTQFIYTNKVLLSSSDKGS